MKTITLLNQTYQVHDRLESFNINVLPSSSIHFFGSNPDSGSMFFQFANGGTYIFREITPEIRKGFWNSESRGSFVAKNIVKKFPSEKLEGKGVAPLTKHH